MLITRVRGGHCNKFFCPACAPSSPPPRIWHVLTRPAPCHGAHYDVICLFQFRIAVGRSIDRHGFSIGKCPRESFPSFLAASLRKRDENRSHFPRTCKCCVAKLIEADCATDENALRTELGFQCQASHRVTVPPIRIPSTENAR